jgi:multiple sugar transport system ATP-binding protein
MEVYSNPASRFVAGFVGSPGMNFLRADIAGSGRTKARLGDGSEIDLTVEGPGSGSYELGIRPEAVRVVRSAESTTRGKAGVVERLGERTLVYCTLSDGSTLIAQDQGRSDVRPGDSVELRFDPTALHLFDAGGRVFHAH